MKEQLILSLKRALKAKGVSYKDLAEQLSISEPSIKRSFSTGSFSLDRFLEICETVDIPPENLFELVSKQSSQDHEYTVEQEEFFVNHPQHLAFFDLLLKGETPQQIARQHSLTISQVQTFLKNLEQINLIDWMPKNKAQLKTSRNIRWRSKGPLRRKLLPLAKEEFLKDSFTANDSAHHFLLTDLSEKSQKKLKVRIQELINELSKDSEIDLLAKSKRKTMGLLLAYRPWNFSLLSTPRAK